MTSRRTFLGKVALASAAAFTGGVSSSFGASGRSSAAAPYLAAQGSVFHARLPDGGVERLVLETVVEERASAGCEAFTVQFRSTAGRALGQGTYRFEHPRIGAVDLFVVPIAEATGQPGCVATFNLLRA